MNHVALCALRLLSVFLANLGNIILQVIEFRLLLLIKHLLVAECCKCLGVPVHHSQTAIDEAFVIKVDKHLYHTLRALLVHSERRTVPIA